MDAFDAEELVVAIVIDIVGIAASAATCSARLTSASAPWNVIAVVQKTSLPIAPAQTNTQDRRGRRRSRRVQRSDHDFAVVAPVGTHGHELRLVDDRLREDVRVRDRRTRPVVLQDRVAADVDRWRCPHRRPSKVEDGSMVRASGDVLGSATRPALSACGSEPSTVQAISAAGSSAETTSSKGAANQPRGGEKRGAAAVSGDRTLKVAVNGGDHSLPSFVRAVTVVLVPTPPSATTHGGVHCVAALLTPPPLARGSEPSVV